MPTSKAFDICTTWAQSSAWRCGAAAPVGCCNYMATSVTVLMALPFSDFWVRRMQRTLQVRSSISKSEFAMQTHPKAGCRYARVACAADRRRAHATISMSHGCNFEVDHGMRVNALTLQCRRLQPSSVWRLRHSSKEAARC